MKEEIKKAVESAEQEIQEKEVAHLKSIIKNLLEKKLDKEKDKREIEKEISVIKQTIDDFKAGRLDKIKELQEKDPVAKEILQFKIRIINQPIITQPWNWHYQVLPQQNPLYASGIATLCNVGSAFTGNNFATLSSGTYQVGDHFINL